MNEYEKTLAKLAEIIALIEAIKKTLREVLSDN